MRRCEVGYLLTFENFIAKFIDSNMRPIDLVGFSLFMVLQISGGLAATVKAKDRQSRKHYPQIQNPSQIQSDSHFGHQMRLLHDLLSKYDPRIRPVSHPSKPVNITVRMNLYQIVEVEERSQHVAIYAWMTQIWHDEILAWRPEEYGNVSYVVLPYTQVWIPDTYLYNNLQMEREASERWSHVIVQMEPKETRAALVTFRYPAMYKFICNMNIAFFPFDHQRCRMQFGSWIFDSSGIDYFPQHMDVAKESFVETGREEWQLVSFTAERRLEQYSCCPNTFSLLEYWLVVQRRPLHYLVNLVIPTFIVSVVSNVGFFTPTTTGGERIEKVNLGLTTLLAYSVLLMMVSDNMPSTSSTVPLIGWYLLWTIVQTSAATIMSSIILVIHKKGNDGKPVPDSVHRFFFGWLNRYLKVKRPNETHDYDDDDACEQDAPVLTRYKPRRQSNVFGKIYFGHNGSTSRRQSLAAPLEGSCINSVITPLVTITDPDGNKNGSQSSLANGNAFAFLNKHVINEVKEPEYDSIEIEWEWLACILDRLCLTLSLLSLLLFVMGVIIVGYIAGKYY